MKVIVQKRFQDLLTKIAEEKGRPAGAIVSEAIRRYVEGYLEEKEEAEFVRLARQGARRLRIRTEGDIEGLIDSIRD